MEELSSGSMMMEAVSEIFQWKTSSNDVPFDLYLRAFSVSRREKGWIGGSLLMGEQGLRFACTRGSEICA